MELRYAPLGFGKRVAEVDSCFLERVDGCGTECRVSGSVRSEVVLVDSWLYLSVDTQDFSPNLDMFHTQDL